MAEGSMPMTDIEKAKRLFQESIKTRDRCYQASEISPRASEFGSDLGRPGFEIRGGPGRKGSRPAIKAQRSSKIVGQF